MGEIEKRAEDSETEKIKIEDRLDVIASQLMDAEEKRERLLSAKQLAKKYAKALDNLDYETKRTIIHDLVKRIVITGENIELELKIPSLSKRRSGNKVRKPYGATGRN